jgi:opacity protein-like surface antigen
MKFPISLAMAFGLAAVLTGAPAAADTEEPPVEHYGSVSYQTGGVGVDEAKLMRQQERNYPLALEFIEQAGKRGEYSAGENVKIQDAQGKTVLSVTADGPFMLVNLPDGRYKVSAGDGGRTQVRQLDLQGKPHDRVAFVWPAAKQAGA